MGLGLFAKEKIKKNQNLIKFKLNDAINSETSINFNKFFPSNKLTLEHKKYKLPSFYHSKNNQYIPYHYMQFIFNIWY